MKIKGLIQDQQKNLSTSYNAALMEVADTKFRERG